MKAKIMRSKSLISVDLVMVTATDPRQTEHVSSDLSTSCSWAVTEAPAQALSKACAIVVTYLERGDNTIGPHAQHSACSLPITLPVSNNK